MVTTNLTPRKLEVKKLREDLAALDSFQDKLLEKRLTNIKVHAQGINIEDLEQTFKKGGIDVNTVKYQALTGIISRASFTDDIAAAEEKNLISTSDIETLKYINKLVQENSQPFSKGIRKQIIEKAQSLEIKTS